MKVRFAVSVGMGPPDPDRFGDVVAEAEVRGFDTVWLSDVPMLGGTDPVLGVAFAAARTSQMHLGINLIPFGSTRFVLAHRLAQLDRLCGGRLLVTLVPGLDQPGERQALGTTGGRRGDMIEDLVPELRSWWAGEGVDVGDGVLARLAVRPLQDPLEIWLGGSGTGAIRRAGRVADGWLGARVAPQRAGTIMRAILDEAKSVGRVIDEEHFGLSIAYARVDSDMDRARRTGPLLVRRSQASSAALRAASSGASLDTDPKEPGAAGKEVVPVGAPELRDLVGHLVAEGLSKFVVRPVASPEPTTGGAGWSDELEWLAAALLDLQT